MITTAKTWGRRIGIAAVLAAGLLLSRPAAAFTVGTTVGNDANSKTASASWSTTAGSLLIASVTIQSYPAGQTPTTPSGWTAGPSVHNSTNIAIFTYYVANAAARSNTTESIDLDNSAKFNWTLCLVEYKGVDITVAASDTATWASAVSSSATTAVSITGAASTSAYDSNLIVVAIGADDNLKFTTTAPLVEDEDVKETGHGATVAGTVSHRFATAALTPSGAETISGSANWAAAILSFHAVRKYWSSTASTNFSTAANWKLSDGTTAAAAPAEYDIALFDSANSNVSCTVDVPPTGVGLGEVRVQGAYSGTVTVAAAKTLLVAGTTTVSTTGGGTLRGQTGAGNLSFTGALNISGGTVDANSGTLAATGAVTVSGGNLKSTSATSTLSSTLTVSGGTVTTAGGTVNVTGAVAVSSGSYNTTTSGTSTFSSTLAVSGSGAVAVASGTTVAVTGAVTVSGGTYTGPGTNNFSSTLTVSGGSLTTAGGTFNVTGAVAVSSGSYNTTTSGTSTFSSTLAVSGSGAVAVASGTTVAVTGAVTVSGGTYTGPGTNNFSSTLTVSGGALTTAGGTFNVTGAVAVSSGSYNTTTSGTSTFSSTLGVSSTGAVSVASGTTLAVTGAVTISGGSYSGAGTSTLSSTLTVSGGTYDGNGGTSTVTGLITVSGGTYNVGSGAQTALAGVTVSSGTLHLNADGGELRIGNGASAQTLTVSGGTLRSTGTTQSTYPKITKGAGGTAVAYNFTVSGGTLNLNGLQVQNLAANGMNVTGTSVTFTSFRNVRFSNNSGATQHLKIARGSIAADFTITASGCAFDTTATTNVAATATSATSKTFYVTFDQASGLGGEGDSRDSDGDASPDNGTVDAFGTNASLVLWAWANQTDTAGSIQGFPSAAFDWNTFTFYSVYAAFSGAATNTDRIYVRTVDGAPNYSYDIDTSTYGSMLGTPRWDTVTETASYDADGDGTYSETNIHVLYIPTSGGYIFKLIDNGSSLALPGTNNVWHTPFPTNAPTGSTTVSTITSPLVADSTNLYFGGTQSGSVKVFGVQIASGGSTCNGSSVSDAQKCARTYDPGVGLTAITNTPSLGTFGGSNYLYMATVNGGTNTIIRYNVTTASASGSYTTTGAVTGSVRRVANGVYAADSAGKLYQLYADPSQGSGSFTDVTGFPYSVSGSPALSTPYVDMASGSGSIYFGDSAGKLYRVDTSGNLVAGWPITTGGSAITASPFVVPSTGYLIAGDTAGKVYYVDVATTSLKYTLTLSGSISTIAYNAAANSSAGAVMVGTSAGGLYYIPKQVP